MKTIKLVLFFLCIHALSFSAGISGYVRDAKTNEALPSATVAIKGSTIGAITDLNGYYELSVIKEGKYTIVASFIGYEQHEVEVTFEKGDEKKLDFLLNPESYNMQEVVIAVQAKGQIKSLKQQVNSEYISNVVSSERLQEVPDATVADALARIPGITVTSDNGEGNKVRIRGMEPRLNLVTINGVRSPSTDETENSVSLAGISPFMIEEIEVQKSLTPDKDGDVVGGIVNMKLKDADQGFHVNTVFQNNYNTLSESMFNPRATLQVSNRFLDNKLGLVVVGNYEDIDRSSERMSAGGNVLSEMDSIQIDLTGTDFWTSEFSRKRYGGSVFLDYRLPKGKIKASSFMNGLSNNEFTRTYNWGKVAGINRSCKSIKSKTFSLVNSLQYEQKLFWNSTLDVGVSYSYAKKETPINYTLDSKYRNPSDYDPNDLPPEIQKISRGEIYPYDLMAQINYYSDSSYFLSSMASSDNTFIEDELTAFINWQVPYAINDNINGYLKIGGKFRKKTRSYDASDRGSALTTGAGLAYLPAYIIANNPNLDFGIGEFSEYIENNLSSFHLLSDYDKNILDDQFRQRGFVERAYMEQIISNLDDNNWSVVPGADHPARNMPDDYSGHEEIEAAYAMTNLNLTRYLQIIGGVRIENTTTNYKSFGIKQSSSIDYDIEEFGDSLSKRQNLYVLPMINAKIIPLDWLQFRLAYTQSIARPQYYSYMPRYYLSLLGAISRIGNPALKPALSHNVDAYFSVKTNNPSLGVAGLFTFGVFYKKIEGYEYVKSYVNIHDSINNVHPYNVIASNRQNNINIPLNNPEPAYSKGIEVDWQGAFIYLPKPFDGIVLNANYTFTTTQQTLVQQLVSKTNPDPLRPWVTQVEVFDSTYTEALFSQPRHVFSSSLGYDYKGFSARIAYTYFAEAYQGNFGSFRENLPENRILASARHTIDLSITQKIRSVKGLQLFFNLSNLTSTFNAKEFVKTSYGGPNYPLKEEYFGSIIILGLRYTM